LAGAIAKAYERKQPWFGYYWAPTPILGKYKMVKVDFGTGIDEKHYLACISKADCKDPRPTMYPSSQVQTVTTEAVASKAPDAFRYLGKRSFTNGKMNTLLAWMDKNQADGDVGMVHFLKNNEAIWMSWVSKAVASKVKKALSAL
jgi:glycine betaine/proline transport system substrate-binding protein